MKSLNIAGYNLDTIIDDIRTRIKDGVIGECEYRVDQKTMQRIYLEHGERFYAYASVRNPHILKNRRMCPGVYMLHLEPLEEK